MRNNKMTISIIAVLVISIISLGVAFAVFSTTLNINGSASVEATNWDIFFTTENDGAKPTQTTTVPEANITPSGTATNQSASIVATTFTWSANFKSPGDKIIYTIYVKNGGNYNARVSNISMPTITCTTDPKSACSELSYGLYTDTAGNTPLSTSFTVDAGDTEVFYLIATLSENYGGTSGANLVTTDVTSSTISATVTFEQTGTAVLNSGTTGGGTSGGNSGGSGSGGNNQASVKYLAYDENWSEFWSDNLSDAVSQTVYVKKTGNKVESCISVNSTEYCFDETTTASTLSQFCTSIGGVFHINQYDENAASCHNPGYNENNISETSQYSVSVELLGRGIDNNMDDPVTHLSTSVKVGDEYDDIEYEYCEYSRAADGSTDDDDIYCGTI